MPTVVSQSRSGGGATVSYCMAEATKIEFSIPTQISTDINTGWFYRVYRSDQQEATVGIQSDFKLIDEVVLTSNELTNHITYYLDSKSESFKGDLLYTNQNSGEGELQANVRPPQAKAMEFYQNHMFYANCVERKILQFSVIDPDDFTATVSYLDVDVGDVSRRYYLPNGHGNSDCDATLDADGSGDLRFTCTSHGIPSTGPTKIFASRS